MKARQFTGWAAWLAMSCAAAVAPAQPAPGEVEQIGAEEAPDTAVGQISHGPRDIQTPIVAAPGPQEIAPGAQVGARRDSRGPTPQLTGEQQSATPPTQLYRGGRTALPSEALSRPSEGRTGAVARVEGEDRCDPAQRPEAREPVCARVIETRAGEFRRVEPVLSAEEKLLVEQRLREQEASTDAAARRLAANAGDPDSLDEQSIAAVVLADPRPLGGAAEAPPEESPSALAEVIANVAAGAAAPQ